MPPSTPLRYTGGRATPYDAEARTYGDAGDAAPTSYRADIAARGRRPFHQPGLFYKDLRLLMYAYGDVPNPSPDSVAVLEEMTVDFLTDLCLRAEPSVYALGLTTSHAAASAIENGETPSTSLRGHPPAIQTHRQRAKLDDIKHALRHDRKKLGRLEQLLYADKMVTEARRIGGVEDVAASAGALVHADDRPAEKGKGKAT
ncbi:hypothetical protein MOBT1_001144 [Malassezia obtusa]|uniref:Transcription initiation factor TFIID subunit 13 n=1 Tax=Malassezia obtusa TaxID=76774 RepID=A0AAF0DYD8_9BASI|nr:hypothetical protein MOBT1_001144 [Malassezia obtusa]